MSFILDAVRFALFLFTLFLLARIVISLVVSFSRDWKPTGLSAVAVESVLTVTDPPIKAVRKVVPPLAIGQVRIDLAFIIVFFGVTMLSQSTYLLEG